MTDPAAIAPALADTTELPVYEPEAASVEIVVCCASARMDLVLQTFPALVAERLHPRAVPGIEHDAAPLQDALGRASGPALFVLCVGTTLHAARTRQLVELFTARRGPLHRLLVLEVDHVDATDLQASIAVAAKSLRRRLAPGGSSRARLRVEDGATIAAGSVSTGGAGLEPVVPRPRIVVSDPLRDEVGPIPDRVIAPPTQRSRPVLHLVPDPCFDEPPADPAAETSRLARDAVIEPPPPRRVPRKGAAALTAASVIVSLAAVLAFEGTPPPRVAAGLATIPSVAPSPTLPKKTALPPAEVTVAAPEPMPEPMPMAAPSEPRPLDIAIAEGRVRELDLLLATHPYPTESTWRAAATRCRARSVDGVRGWRLPRVDELRALWRHKMLPYGLYWTIARAPGATVPANQTFDASTGRTTPKAKDELAGTVCVRSRTD